jgi:hypothetical protein
LTKKITRTGTGGMMERLGNKLINVKFVHPGFAFVEEHDIFNFMPA